MRLAHILCRHPDGTIYRGPEFDFDVMLTDMDRTNQRNANRVGGQVYKHVQGSWPPTYEVLL